ncbi:MAG: undecaprenyl/decaprenyl-phosphate alpha-N-acetylglucosaminyl 1-phosphate transferase [Alphaproteobacteria bacterium]|nr:undecaprenyl/decaprenyl-phosphate alpha-N-acetylglucosaminyl 1-phosphate transferase [Alphaproteobacteria bacterium]
MDYVVYALTAAATLAICWRADAIARVLGVMDEPDGKRKLHARATPLVGGLAIMLPVIGLGLLCALTPPLDRFFLAIALAGGGATLLGYLDDRRHIPALRRLIVSVAIGAGAMLYAPGFVVDVLHFSLPGATFFLGVPAGVTFTMFCLVGLQNAVNMADGKNGLVIGMALIWVLILMAHAPEPLVPLLVVFSIGLAITFVFNVRGRLFLGDAGTYGLSMTLGLIAIYVYEVTPMTFRADTAALLFLIPVVDTLRLMLFRALAGHSPFRSDRCHFHHILLELMPWHWSLLVYLALVAIPSFLARYWPEWALLWAIGAVAIYVCIAALRYRVAMARPLGHPFTG